MDKPRQMTAADQAVRYILDRIQTDPDFYWVSGPMTQTFHLLCVAESEFTGKRLDQVEAERSRDLQPPHRKRDPEVLTLRKELETLRG